MTSISGISMEPLAKEDIIGAPKIEPKRMESTGCNEQYCRSPCSLWRSVCKWYSRLLEAIFAFSGRCIASHPWITICFCLLLVGICSVGFIRFKVENRTEKLFIPQNSQAVRDLNRADKYFGLKVREETVILEVSPGTNVLTTKCFNEALNIHKEILKIDSYVELCAKTAEAKNSSSPESCILLNLLEVFSFKDQNLVNVSQHIDKSLKNFHWLMRNGRPLVSNLPRLLGGQTKDDRSGEIVARAIQMTYFLQDPADDKSFADISNFEDKFVKTVSRMEDKITCGNLYYSVEKSLDDAIAESSGSDISLVSITFTLMISFACTTLGKFKNPLTGHSLLANAGVFAVALGILSGFGLSLFVGVPFISMVGVLPFLIIGIGIDDMFIILDELDRHKPQDVVNTVKVVMANSGATITMTTLTDLVAFAVSTTSQFPAIKYFCVYAALSLTFAYLMIVTFFVAIMTLDIRRIKSGHRDCLPFCHAPQPKEGMPAWDEPQLQTSNKAMKHWATFLMLPGTKVAVVILSLGLLGIGIYGATLTDERFDRRLLAKDDSYLVKFLDAQERNFDLSIPVSIVLTESIKYEDPSIQDGIRKLAEIVEENQYYKNVTLSWLDMFTSYTKKMNLNVTTKRQFTSSLKTFLDTSGRSFREDIKLSDDGEQIEASRIIAQMEDSSSSTFQRDAMLTLRKDISSKSELPAFPITKTFIFFEQYAIILRATIQNLVIAAVAILVITSPLLVDFTVTMLVFLGFVALILELFGLMYIWGVSLNSISMINLVMALGFSVDYCAHIAHAFVTSQEETPNGRVIDALSTLGASVLMGGLSTFIGMVVTAFAASEIFRIFFRMFFGIVCFGLLHGLCFLPVYLSLICWKPAAAFRSESRVADTNEMQSPSVGTVPGTEEGLTRKNSTKSKMDKEEPEKQHEEKLSRGAKVNDSFEPDQNTTQDVGSENAVNTCGTEETLTRKDGTSSKDDKEVPDKERKEKLPERGTEDTASLEAHCNTKIKSTANTDGELDPTGEGVDGKSENHNLTTETVPDQVQRAKDKTMEGSVPNQETKL